MQQAPIAPDIDLAGHLFERLKAETADVVGVTRAAYGSGEAAAHRLCRAAAEQMSLEVATDAAGNLYLTLPGQQRRAPRIVIGSHLDSVPKGGNFDGAAGVVAGLAAVSGLKRKRIVPARDVTIIAIRAEEGVWFPESYIGSRMALGRLDPDLLDTLKRSDTGKTLAEHIAAAGFDPDAVRAGHGGLIPAEVGAFIEPHIEQGPVLATENVPLGIVTAIRGNFRYRSGRCIGEYGHSGTVPRRLRHDAVVSTAELVCYFEELWDRYEAAGRDLSMTFGKFATDSAVHGFSRVAGMVDFAVDMRSADAALLAELHEQLWRVVRSIEAKHGVRFALQDYSEAASAEMNSRLRVQLRQAAERNALGYREMPSGAGHDAVAFASAGIPTAMLFIRNENGSHNPDEAMTMEDLSAAATVLADMVVAAPHPDS